MAAISGLRAREVEGRRKEEGPGWVALAHLTRRKKYSAVTVITLHEKTSIILDVPCLSYT